MFRCTKCKNFQGQKKYGGDCSLWSWQCKFYGVISGSEYTRADGCEYYEENMRTSDDVMVIVSEAKDNMELGTLAGDVLDKSNFNHVIAYWFLKAKENMAMVDELKLKVSWMETQKYSQPEKKPATEQKHEPKPKKDGFSAHSMLYVYGVGVLILIITAFRGCGA